MTRLRLQFVHEYRDRHGRLRRYVRKPGSRRIPLPGLPGSPEFMEAYQSAIGSVGIARPNRACEGTLGALAEQFFGSPEFANLKSSSQVVYRKALDAVLTRHGHRMVRDLPPDKARKVIEEIGARAPGMANLARAVLLKLFEYAITIGARVDNPFERVPRYKLGTFHTWTDEEIAAYESRWPLGTRERLAFSLMLFTAQRIGDVVRMQRSHLVEGTAIRVTQGKTGAELEIALHSDLVNALKAGPTKGLYLIGDQFGRPITAARLRALMIAAARAAGLPRCCVPHGLRKAALRRLAEHGATTRQIAAVSGHKTLKEIERYTAAADQRRLARSAIGRLGRKSLE